MYCALQCSADYSSVLAMRMKPITPGRWQPSQAGDQNRPVYLAKPSNANANACMHTIYHSLLQKVFYRIPIPTYLKQKPASASTSPVSSKPCTQVPASKTDTRAPQQRGQFQTVFPRRERGKNLVRWFGDCGTRRSGLRGLRDAFLAPAR